MPNTDPLMSIIEGVVLFLMVVAVSALAINQFVQAWVTWIRREHKGVDRDYPVQEWDEPTYQVSDYTYTKTTEVPAGLYDEIEMDPPPRKSRQR